MPEVIEESVDGPLKRSPAKSSKDTLEDFINLLVRALYGEALFNSLGSFRIDCPSSPSTRTWTSVVTWMSNRSSLLSSSLDPCEALDCRG